MLNSSDFDSISGNKTAYLKVVRLRRSFCTSLHN